MSANKRQKALEKRRRRRQQKRNKARTFGPEVVLLDHIPGAVKMSEVLLEFVEPYSELAPDEESLGKLLWVAVVAWNAALLSGGERQALIDEAAATLPRSARGDYRAMLEELIRRKLEQFSTYRRPIVDFQLTMQSGRPYLQVASALEP